MQDTLHNPRKRAPEHVQLINNLISCDHSTHAKETHLPRDVKAWETLGSHIDAVAQPADASVERSRQPLSSAHAGEQGCRLRVRKVSLVQLTGAQRGLEK